jgi:hypothetical protein
MAGRTTEGDVHVTDGTQPNGAAGADRDPWAPPEHRPSLDKTPQQPVQPPPVQDQPPSVHDQATVISMPSDGFAPPAPPAPPAASGYGPPGPAPVGSPVPPPPPAPSGPGPGPGIPAPPPVGYGYGYPGGYGWPGMPMTPQNGMGIASLVLGILSLCLFCLYGVVSVVLGILAVVFGIKGRRRAERGEADNRGQAQAGLVMGIIGIVLGVAVIVLIAIGISFALHDGGTDSDPYYGSAHTVSATFPADR